MTYTELGVDLSTIMLVKRIIEHPNINEVDSRIYEIICKMANEISILFIEENPNAEVKNFSIYD